MIFIIYKRANHGIPIRIKHAQVMVSITKEKLGLKEKRQLIAVMAYWLVEQQWSLLQRQHTMTQQNLQNTHKWAIG